MSFRPTDPEGFVDKAQVLAFKARKSVLQMTSDANASHVGSCLSVVDILASLYSGAVGLDNSRINEAARPRVILSKGHAAAALYAVLAHAGFIELTELDRYGQNGAKLGGHVTHKGNPGVELSTGSLGHGLPYGVGIALGLKQLGLDLTPVYVVISDGECDEGTTWESALIASHFKLNNLIILIDRNRLQSLADTEETIALEPLPSKWESFNWDVTSIDGHSHVEIIDSLAIGQRPKCIIANTTKGKGVSFMENSVKWHYKSPNNEELAAALSELNQ
jgi:transketolase